jgi:hypothetical protein
MVVAVADKVDDDGGGEDERGVLAIGPSSRIASSLPFHE